MSNNERIEPPVIKCFDCGTLAVSYKRTKNKHFWVFLCPKCYIKRRFEL